MSVGAVLIAYLLLSQIQARSTMDFFSTAVPPLTAKANAAVSPGTGTSPMLEVHIANNGLVLLRGARVVSIQGGTIVVDTDFGGGNFVWTIQTNTNTEFPTASSTNATIADIEVGEFVEVTGLLAQGGTQPTIQAQFVRNEDEL